MSTTPDAFNCALTLLVECEQVSARWPEHESARLGPATARVLLTVVAGLARRPPSRATMREVCDAVVELRMLLGVARALQLLDPPRHARLSGLATRLQAALLSPPDAESI